MYKARCRSCYRVMASEEHLSLANKIKSLHLSLRLRTREIGSSEAWREHCSQADKLQEYAASMKELATVHWDKSDTDSRISWVVEQCRKYYLNDGYTEEINREVTLCEKLGIPYNSFSTKETRIFKSKFTLLDVGSCYNPFAEFDLFDVLAIDISPASREVHKCDFLNVSVIAENSTSFTSNYKLTANSFDVVVFSLFLEYLPCPEQRYQCCENAAKVLRSGGILCIVTPDSKHATANAHIMKKWRYALAKLGMLRIAYEKLPHMHCMVFRKCFSSELPIKWVPQALGRTQSEKDTLSLIDPKYLIVIPQDFHNYESNNVLQEKQPRSEEDYENTVFLFEHLPEL